MKHVVRFGQTRQVSKERGITSECCKIFILQAAKEVGDGERCGGGGGVVG